MTMATSPLQQHHQQSHEHGSHYHWFSKEQKFWLLNKKYFIKMAKPNLINDSSWFRQITDFMKSWWQRVSFTSTRMIVAATIIDFPWSRSFACLTNIIWTMKIVIPELRNGSTRFVKLPIQWNDDGDESASPALAWSWQPLSMIFIGLKIWSVCQTFLN